MGSFEDYLRDYVRLLVRKGVNIQKGQLLVISCGVENAHIARLAVEEAYEAGASDVNVQWGDDKVVRTRYLKADSAVFDEFPPYRKLMFDTFIEKGAASLNIASGDPENLKGVDPDRLVRATKAAQEPMKKYREATMTNKNRWCVAAVPCDAWAKKVFPNAKDIEEAKTALWELIFKASRVDDNGSVSNWDAHMRSFKARIKTLNDYNFKSLRYKNSIGSDFTINLAPNHIWEGGGDVSQDGIPFLPNVPTEEIFTAPDKDGINGRVVSSMPLVRNGNVIDKFWFEFKDGVAVSYGAEVGKEFLDTIIKTSKNADRLGEVALVPFKSPISEMKTLFYNTLYDENASCHLALGAAYANSIKGGAALSEEEREKAGLNVSAEHCDFMIGTEDLNITGITQDGKEVPVFTDGNFAF
ncbi:aminopeptidase [Clostridia bacterium]|nr:aminopeptidase [Clostridia bacterium]GHV39720.1 aminopeptidase [Clostridia bacterium]